MAQRADGAHINPASRPRHHQRRHRQQKPPQSIRRQLRRATAPRASRRDQSRPSRFPAASPAPSPPHPPPASPTPSGPRPPTHLRVRSASPALGSTASYPAPRIASTSLLRRGQPPDQTPRSRDAPSNPHAPAPRPPSRAALPPHDVGNWRTSSPERGASAILSYVQATSRSDPIRMKPRLRCLIPDTPCSPPWRWRRSPVRAAGVPHPTSISRRPAQPVAPQSLASRPAPGSPAVRTTPQCIPSIFSVNSANFSPFACLFDDSASEGLRAVSSSNLRLRGIAVARLFQGMTGRSVHPRLPKAACNSAL